jgi:hypothetical protein
LKKNVFDQFNEIESCSSRINAPVFLDEFKTLSFVTSHTGCLSYPALFRI